MGEDDLLCNRGFVIKVYDGNAYGEYSFNDISEEKIEDAMRKMLSDASLRAHFSEKLGKMTHIRDIGAEIKAITE